MTTPDPGTLAELINAHTRGLHHHSAAAGLLISHHYWLTRTDFTDGFIDLITDQSGQATGARIDYTAAINAINTGRLPCSASEAAILTLAASLADGTPIALSKTLGNLDHRNITLLTHAIATANGTPPTTSTQVRPAHAV